MTSLSGGLIMKNSKETQKRKPAQMGKAAGADQNGMHSG